MLFQGDFFLYSIYCTEKEEEKEKTGLVKYYVY